VIADRVYVVDTSSLIDLARLYPRDVFSSLWDALERMCDDSRLCAPREVFRELTRRDDEIARWAKSKPALFVEVDEEQARVLAEIAERFPEIADEMKLGPHADPWLVALALVKNRSMPADPCHVVTEERPGGPGSVKLPNVCSQFGVRTLTLLEFFREEGLKF
jgi:Domain of unknown function (DUF4411)